MTVKKRIVWLLVILLKSVRARGEKKTGRKAGGAGWAENEERGGRRKRVGEK